MLLVDEGYDIWIGNNRGTEYSWDHETLSSKDDNAYWMWNFQGKILKRSNVDRFCQLVWRPRPQSLLSKEQLKDVKKNLKKYSDQFNAKDKMRQSKVG